MIGFGSYRYKYDGFAPHILEGLPGHPGPARPQKRTPQNPARLPSSTQIKCFSWLWSCSGFVYGADNWPPTWVESPASCSQVWPESDNKSAVYGRRPP